MFTQAVVLLDVAAAGVDRRLQRDLTSLFCLQFLFETRSRPDAIATCDLTNCPVSDASRMTNSMFCFVFQMLTQPVAIRPLQIGVVT